MSDILNRDLKIQTNSPKTLNFFPNSLHFLIFILLQLTILEMESLFFLKHLLKPLFPLPFRSMEVLQLTFVQADSLDHRYVQAMGQIMYRKEEGPKVTRDRIFLSTSICVEISFLSLLSTDKILA